MMKDIYSIEDLRKQLKMSQVKVATALGISKMQYRAREKKPEMLTFGQIEKLAVLFEISFNEMWILVQMQIEGGYGKR